MYFILDSGEFITVMVVSLHGECAIFVHLRRGRMMTDSVG